MKVVILFAIAMILTTVPASPAPIPICVKGSLVTYAALTSGCSVSDLVFDNFFYNDQTIIATKMGVPADSVNVTPLTGVEEGLKFSGSFGAGPGSVEDQLLSFAVHTEDGQAIIGDLGLSMEATVSGDGSVLIGESADNSQYHLETFTAPFGTQLSIVRTISPPLSSLDLKKDILLVGGPPSTSADDTAELTSFSETFSTVPEPSFSWIIGGLPLLMYLKKRNRSDSSSNS